MKKILVVFILFLYSNISFSQGENVSTNTDGNLTFSVLTVSNGATYSPKNVLAIWIKDANGNFVISRKVMANNRKQHLVKWMASSGNNSVDAITGSTLSNHTTHTVSWDCRDLQGNIVPDGDYQVWVEYTSRNSASGGQPGPSFSYTFAKGTEIVQPQIPNETYFVNISLLYEPTGIDVIVDHPDADLYQIQPNPVVNDFMIQLKLIEPSYLNASIYDMGGKRVMEVFDGYITDLNYVININNRVKKKNLIPGTYILRLNIDGRISSKKLVVIS
ncbi:MAG: DUF2271 domain-containing protein [Bacteroidales bacterium]|nr:DUF2271 domain-containing protein [Bacteroidales bacterium]